jgi:hypothetical protein
VSYSHVVGELAVLNFMMACYQRGYFFVSRPATFDPGYDVVPHNPSRYDDAGKNIWRLQVKTAYLGRERYWTGDTRRPQGHYDVDAFVFWKPDTNEFWIVDGKHLKKRHNKWRGRPVDFRRSIQLLPNDEHFEYWAFFGSPPEWCSSILRQIERLKSRGLRPAPHGPQLDLLNESAKRPEHA